MDGGMVMWRFIWVWYGCRGVFFLHCIGLGIHRRERRVGLWIPFYLSSMYMTSRSNQSYQLKPSSPSPQDVESISAQKRIQLHAAVYSPASSISVAAYMNGAAPFPSLTDSGTPT
jgi:hypothetical protein